MAMLRATLAQAGVDYTRYAGHSFRIGAATTVAAKGMSESMIQTLRRWASDSFKQYIRIPRSQLARFSKQLATDYLRFDLSLHTHSGCLTLYIGLHSLSYPTIDGHTLDDITLIVSQLMVIHWTTQSWLAQYY